MMKKLLALYLIILLCGCAFRENPPAPIVDGIAQFAGPISNTSNTGENRVTSNGGGGSTTTTQIARLTPVTANAGETDTSSKIIYKNVHKKTMASNIHHNAKAEETEGASSVYRDGWVMPVSGGITGKFNASQKGVEIKAKPGTTVYAASAGKVVYSGNGLKGYGNLIIIRHDNGYLTAYALNRVNLVKVGQNVQSGDKIAEVGDAGILHFELRKNGKPVNPVDYISGK